MCRSCLASYRLNPKGERMRLQIRPNGLLSPPNLEGTVRYWCLCLARVAHTAEKSADVQSIPVGGNLVPVRALTGIVIYRRQFSKSCPVTA